MDNVFNSILRFNLNEYYDLMGNFGSFCGGKTKKKQKKYKKQTLKNIKNIKRKKKKIQ